MSLSSGKASGKTEAVDAAFRFIGRLAEGDLAKGLIAAQKRIGELEAELRTECVHCGQPIPHVHKHESTRELALRLRAENAEAEVTEQRKAAEKLVLEFKAEIERLRAERDSMRRTAEASSIWTWWKLAITEPRNPSPMDARVQLRARIEELLDIMKGGGRESESLLARKATPRTEASE